MVQDFFAYFSRVEMAGEGPSAEEINEWWDDGIEGLSLEQLALTEAEIYRDLAFDFELGPVENHPDVVTTFVSKFQSFAERFEAWAAITREDYLDVLNREIAEEASTLEAVIERTNREYFTITKDGGYSVGREQLNPTTGHREVKFFTEGAIKKDLDRKRVEVPESDGKSKLVGIGTAWLTHSERRHYRHLTFDPNHSLHEGVGDNRTFNLFRGFAVEPDPLEDWSPLDHLIRDVICGGHKEQYDFIIRWAAKMVQYPSEPAGVVLSIPGPKGSGKGTLGRALVGLVAPHGKQLTQPEQLTGKFNKHLAETIGLFVDEAYWSGDKKAENALKALITEPTFMCEPKGVDSFEVNNHLHIVMATNNDWAAPVEFGDRRYAVFSPEPEAVSEFKSRIGFGRILEGQGRVKRSILAGMMSKLMRVDVNGWRADEHIPVTDALRRQRALTAQQDPMLGWWESVLQRGGLDRLRIPGWPSAIGEVSPSIKDELEVDIRSYHQQQPYRVHIPDKSAIGRWLKEKFKYQIDGNVGAGPERRRGWILPTLAQARKDFEDLLGTGTIEWEPFGDTEGWGDDT
ncbi:primase-helicase family protein [uncultured Ruegeria sp.]|uniref:primase-helicase family protein n=1 Tax=uncultured Ruegeria sp. TaxID=259304 RepID=UPI00263039F1|nr:primase-helicase family protein [uncultured Ruegeria sp.]